MTRPPQRSYLVEVSYLFLRLLYPQTLILFRRGICLLERPGQSFLPLPAVLVRQDVVLLRRIHSQIVESVAKFFRVVEREGRDLIQGRPVVLRPPGVISARARCSAEKKPQILVGIMVYSYSGPLPGRFALINTWSPSV